MDVLSDVLRAVRLSGSVFFTAEMRAPWSVESPPPEVLGAALGGDAEWFMLFHVVAEGSCLFELDAERSIMLEAGDVAIFPHGDPHVMASAPQHRGEPTPVATLLSHIPLEEPCRVSHGSGSETTTRVICGYLKGDEHFGPLARALPPMLCVRTGDGEAVIETARGDVHTVGSGSPIGPWVETSLRYAVHEAAEGRAGAVSMLSRLAELLFVQVLRTYMQKAEPAGASWLAGLQDVHVGRALELMHERPGHDWTVDELGREVGLSRSALARRFSDRLGETPMRYLTAWRMQLARRLMRDPRLGLAEIAERVGYDSEAAFHRAFKRDAGEPPATWRRQHLGV